MDKLRNQIVTEKSIRLLQQNQYTFQVNPEVTKTEMKDWVEQLFDVEVEGTNSSRMINRKRKSKKFNFNFTNRKKMIVRLKSNYVIPLFLNQT
uniref:Large ribosomal subunit protein uL23c n=1 Tax=Hemionitis ludens TaxID=377232 RepID=A0A3G5CT35_HEMLU|nr:ribosomal protein L23 [Calciphilopteris ludens]AYW16029.1 ribosomal protein L23 [Calciphilopteris ludens]